jgi:hypothetical protein
MIPKEFNEQTVIVAENQTEYSPLPAHVATGDPEGKLTCCWQLSWRERLAVLFRGVLWHQVLTFNQPLQPQLLSVDADAVTRALTAMATK